LSNSAKFKAGGFGVGAGCGVDCGGGRKLARSCATFGGALLGGALIGEKLVG
jgi:hypothetical protein